MGNEASTAEEQHPEEHQLHHHLHEVDDDPFEGIETLGYRVLGVQPNSPAAQAGLVSFLDFLVGANNKMLLGSGEDLEEGDEYDDVDLPALLEEFKGQPVEFLVWNIKSQQQRLVSLTPSDTWGGAGLLGVTIRLDNYAGAEDRLIRVLTVEDKSPAAVAGLVPEKDFLLGTTHQTLDCATTLAAILHEHQDRIVELYVYNCDSDVVRVVALMPTLSWGGPGLLGAEVGTGYLHQLPKETRETEGSSVQRKVRYVGQQQKQKQHPKKPSEQQQQQQEQSSASSSNDGAAATNNNHKNNSAVLELEPQLEMEPEPAEEAEEATEASTGDLSSVGLEENVEDERAKRQQTASKDIPAPVENDADLGVFKQEGGQGPPPPPEQSSATEDSAPAALSETAPAAAAPQEYEVAKHDAPQDVFSKPPPTPAMETAGESSSLLPPPPKLHYETPPKM